MAKSDSIPFVTPWFTARYPKLSEPDTKGKFADGKFKTDGVLGDAEYAVAEKALKAAAKQLWPNEANVQLPLKEFKNKDKKPDGRGFTLKSQYRSAVFDAKKKPLPEGVKIGGGTEMRVASALFPWSKSSKMQVKAADGTITTENITEYGVGMRLGDIQVRKLVENQTSGDGSAFDETEGFEYDGEGDTTTSSFDSATDL